MPPVNEQPRLNPDMPVNEALVNARYIDVAETVLGGVSPVPPPEVLTTLRGVEKPDLVAWEGGSTWATAYIAALRPIAMARAIDRTRAIRSASTAVPFSGQTFNTRWTRAHLQTEPGHLQDKISKQVYNISAPAGSEEALAGQALWQQVHRAARNVSLANAVHTPKEVPSNTWADREGPRANLQHYYGGVLDWFTQMPPRTMERTVAGRHPTLPDAILAVGPTAIGKTMVGGDFLARAGIGELRPDGQRRRALWITVTQALIEDCLDSEKTLQKCLGDNIRTTAIWEDHKDEDSASGDLVCASVQSLEQALEEGLISPDDFDLLVFDEAHYVLSARLTQLIQTFDCRKILLTATPTRSQQRNLLLTQHYVRPLGRREAVERGMLSSVRLVTYAAESQEHSEEIAARAAVNQFILQGKKVVVYCKSGKNKEGVSSAQAVRVAALINRFCAEEMGVDYDPTINYAEMVGSARPDSPAVRRYFEDQAHGGALTTSQMLGVGWDFVGLHGTIHVGEQTDLVAFEQETGRAMRPNPDDSEAVLIEVTVPIREGRDTIPRYCLSQLFGLDEITGPNVVIGQALKSSGNAPPPTEADDAEPGGDAPEPETQDSSTVGAGAGPSPAPSPDQDRDKESGIRRDDYGAQLHPDLAAVALSEGTSIIEIIIAPDRRERYVPPPEYSAADTDLAAQYDLPLSYIHYHLDPREGLPTVSHKRARRVFVPDYKQGDNPAQSPYQRYYNTAELAARLALQPMPVTSEEHIYSKATMARILHVPEVTINASIAALGFPHREATKPGTGAGLRSGKPVPRYSLEELTRIGALVELVPLAAPDDVPVYTLRDLYPLGIKTLDPQQRVVKRHPPTSDRKGTDIFVDAATVQLIEAIDRERRTELIAVRAIAERVDLAPPVFMRNLTEYERRIAKSNRFAPPGGTRFAPHLPRDVAAAVEARLMPRGLQPYEVPMTAILGRVDAPPMTVQTYVKRETGGPVDVRRLPGRLAYSNAIYHIAALAIAEGHFPLREGAQAIDHAELAATLATGDTMYARRVQLAVLGIPEEQLVKLEAAASSTEQVEQPVSEAASDPAPPPADVAATAEPVAADMSPPAPDVDADYMYSELRCSPETFEILLCVAGASEEQVVRTSEGELLGCNRDVFQSIVHYRMKKKHLHPSDGWFSLPHFMRNLNLSNAEAIALLKVAIAKDGEHGVRVCTIGSGPTAKCEVYISSVIYRREWTASRSR